MPSETGHARYWHARALAGRTDDRTAAKRMLDESIDRATALGMRDLVLDASAVRALC